MKKLLAIATVQALVLVATVPAFAQTAFGGDAAVLQYSCDQAQAAVSTQFQSSGGTGAVAGAAQSSQTDQQQVLACFGTGAAAQESSLFGF